MPSDTTKTIQKVEKKGSDKKNAKPKKDNKKKKGGFFSSIVRYFKDVAGELKRVTWPTRKELVSATGAVIVFVLIMALIVGVLDTGFYRLMFRPLTSIGASDTELVPVSSDGTVTNDDGVGIVGADEVQPGTSEESDIVAPEGLEDGAAGLVSDPNVEPEVITGSDEDDAQ